MMHLWIRIAAKIVAVLHKDRATTVGCYLEAVPGQVQVAIDLRSQQAAYVGAIRVNPVFIEIAANGCATDIVVSLEA
jgi:hypothetical protein